MSGIETLELVEPWLYGVLHGDATLNTMVGGRYESMMGDGGPDLELPKVVWSFVSSRDITNQQGERIDTESLYDVKVVGQGSSFVPLKPIAARIDVLLNAKVASFMPGSLTCVRDRILQHIEPSVGAKYLHLGATYKIRCSLD